MVSDFRQYRRKHIAELRPYVSGEDLSGVSISAPDKEGGSPKVGDMIARNPKNHKDQWLVAEQYFKDNFEPVEAAARVRAEGNSVAGSEGTENSFILRAVGDIEDLADDLKGDRGVILEGSAEAIREAGKLWGERVRIIAASAHPAPQPSGTVEAEAEIAWRALEEIIRRADPSKLSPIQYEAAAAAAKIAKNALNIRGEIRAVNVPTDMFPTPPTAGGGDA